MIPLMYKGCLKNCARLCGCCGGAVDKIILLFAQFYRSVFSLEFEILFESISHVVADLWQRNGKISGCFKNSNVKIKFPTKEF